MCFVCAFFLCPIDFVAGVVLLVLSVLLLLIVGWCIGWEKADKWWRVRGVNKFYKKAHKKAR
jgi:hypothetical protein